MSESKEHAKNRHKTEINELQEREQSSDKQFLNKRCDVCGAILIEFEGGKKGGVLTSN